jgi:hypothetical protein
MEERPILPLSCRCRRTHVRDVGTPATGLDAAIANTIITGHLLLSLTNFAIVSTARASMPK